MFEWSRERMKQHGFHHYEVSNWARDGRECRHNLVYWHNGDWLGMGPGAHSHMFDERFADAASPRRYVELVNETEGGEGLDTMRQVAMREGPDREREMSETAFLALRLREGLDISAWEARFGVDIMEVFGEAVRETQELGLTELVDGRLRLREEAVLLGDEAFMRFLEPAASSNMI